MWKEDLKMEVNVDENVRYRVPLFDRSNYSNWKFRLKALLDEKDLLQFAEKPLPEILAQYQIANSDTSAVKTAERKIHGNSSEICKKMQRSHRPENCGITSGIYQR